MTKLMKRALFLLMMMLMLGAGMAQEVVWDTLENGKMAVIREEGQDSYREIGLSIFQTDSTPERNLFFTNMNVPFIKHSQLISKNHRDRRPLNLEDIYQAFYSDSTIEVWGTCGRDDMKAPIEEYGHIRYHKLKLDGEWMVRESGIILRLTYSFKSNTPYQGGPRMSLFRNYDLEGNHIKDYMLTGLGDEMFTLSKNGKYALVYNGTLSDLGFVPCGYGSLVYYNLETHERLYSPGYAARYPLADSLIGKYTSQTSLRGNTLIQDFYPRENPSLEGAVFYRVMDFAKDQDYFFSVPVQARGSLQFLPEGIQYQDAQGKLVSHRYQSDFFHVTH